MNKKIPILLISGPVGVGKSTTGGEVSEILASNNTPHTFLDFDQVRYSYPRPADDPWGNRLGFENLGSIWQNCARYGSLNLVISEVVESPAFLDSLLQVIPEGEVTTVQLSASIGTLEARLREREIGSGLDWHINRAGELLNSLAEAPTPSDYRVETDGRAVIEIAEEIVALKAWRLI